MAALVIEAAAIASVLALVGGAGLLAARLGVRRVRNPGRPNRVTERRAMSSLAWAALGWTAVIPATVAQDAGLQARSEVWELVLLHLILLTLATAVMWWRAPRVHAPLPGAAPPTVPVAAPAPTLTPSRAVGTALFTARSVHPRPRANGGRGRRIPEGWYPDPEVVPSDPPVMRWFDGHRWTGATVQTAGTYDDPSGWYPDPFDDGLVRFWDGEDWTAQTLRWGDADRSSPVT